MCNEKCNFRNSLLESQHNICKTWSILKETIGKHNNKTSFPQTFVINEIEVSDKNQIAEGFNNYFSKLASRQIVLCLNQIDNFSKYMPRPSVRSMFLEPVMPSDIICLCVIR